MLRFKKLSLVSIALAFFIAPQIAAAQEHDFKLALTCAAVPIVADTMLSGHVLAAKEDAAFVDRVVEAFAGSIDPGESLLTEAEYQALERRVRMLVKAVRKGDCSDFAQLRKDQVQWQKEMEDFARKELAKDRPIDKSLVLELDPDKRPRPRNAEEQAKLRRALLDFQLANYLAADTKLEEAKEKLLHRYELFTRRMGEQTDADIYGAFLNSYAQALDPHTTYFSTEDMEDFQIQMQLSLQGIGAVLRSKDGYTTVEEVVAGGAADRHGKLKPKDQIIAVAQGAGEPVDVIDMDLRDVVRLIRGKKGTKVTLTVLRKGETTQRLRFTIVRDKIDLAEQAAQLSWREVKRGKKTLKVAIIDLPSFYLGEKQGDRSSAEDMTRLVKEAKSKGADAMVLDLSRNGGGVLNSAVQISGLFIERGPIVGVSAGNPKLRPRLLNDDDPAVHWDGPLVVLTSKVSASASEILAGALQDYGRAVVVGDTHTYGKGSVQQLHPLPPGIGMLKVTTALYFLPAGDSTQSSGVTADVVVPSIFEPLEIGEKHQKNAMAPMSVKAFSTADVNEKGAWKKVSSQVVAGLKKKSARRIAKSAEFKKLAKEIAKADSDDTTVKLSEILAEGKSGQQDDDDDKPNKNELSLQAKEAAEIAADLAEAL